MRFFITILTITTMIQTNSCKEKADLIIHNATVYTVDSNFTIAESIAIKNGKILDVGAFDDLKKKYKADSLFDADGQFIYPGFIDAHCHFYGLALTMKYIDLTGMTSYEKSLEKLKEQATPEGQNWIIGRGWDQNLWPEKAFPNNVELNELFPKNPVALIRIDGHACIANNKALEIAGINQNTVIEGGMVEVKNGKPTGLLLDAAADKMRSLIPEPKGKELEKLLLNAEKKCFKDGLTTVCDAGLDKDEILFLERLQDNGILHMNIYAMINPTEENFEYFFHNDQYKKGKMHVGAIKLYADGALGSRGACLLEPYNDDPENTGFLVKSPEYMKEICQKGFENDFQMCIHAIGDSAVRIVINIYKEFLKDQNSRRWRIEHAQIVHPDDLEAFGKYSIIPLINTTHAISDMGWAESRLGDKRIHTSYAFKDLLIQNGWLANGSDFPIEGTSALFGFYTGVFRKDKNGNPENGFLFNNRLSREEALKAMTIWAAKSIFQEDVKGSIEPGKNADLVFLNNDILKTTREKTLQTKVLLTISEGKIVYEDPQKNQ